MPKIPEITIRSMGEIFFPEAIRQTKNTAHINANANRFAPSARNPPETVVMPNAEERNIVNAVARTSPATAGRTPPRAARTPVVGGKKAENAGD